MSACVTSSGGVPMRGALSCEERLAIFDRYTAGDRLVDIAEDMGVHYQTVRKWSRIGRRQGRPALVNRPRKPSRRPCESVAPRVMERLLKLRDQHRRSWGVPYLRRRLMEDPALSDRERATIPTALAAPLRPHRQDPYRGRGLRPRSRACSNNIRRHVRPLRSSVRLHHT